MLFLSQDCAGSLARMRPESHGPSVGEAAEIKGVATLEDLLMHLWPDLFEED